VSRIARGANRANTTLAGISLAMVAMVCFATLDSTTKYVSTSAPVFMAVWFRYTVQAVLTTAVVLPMRGKQVLRTAHPKFQVLRGVLLLSTSLLAFLSLRFMPVGEFTAIMMMAPLIITLLAATLLAEKVSALRWVLVVGGFVGTLIIVRPGRDAFDWHTLLPISLAFCLAWFQTLTSKLAKTEDPATMHLYTGWVAALVCALGLPFVWQALPSNQTWWLIAAVGVFGAIGHFLLILSYQRAPASTITPYLYTQIGFAMLAGWLVFSHLPDGFAFFGMALIAVCGAAGAWLVVRESKILIEPADS
jgi:drug/metabolite transporter (DMT)-like permease